MKPELGQRLRRALATPHVLLAGLLLLASIVFVIRGAGPRVPRPTPVETTGPSSAVNPPVEVRLLLVDADGLQRPHFETLSLPEGRSARMTAIVDALRRVLQDEGVWPQSLTTPKVFVQDVDGQVVAVLDVRASAAVAVSVSQELQLLRSIEGSVLGNGVDEVRFLTDGRPATTLLGHVAVGSAL